MADKPENKKDEPAATKEASATKPPPVIELNLLNPTDAIRAAKTSLANEINILTDPNISSISKETRKALNALLGDTHDRNIVSVEPRNTGEDLFRLASKLHDHEEGVTTLNKSTRQEIKEKILDRISPTITTSITDSATGTIADTQYSIAKSLDAIKEKMTADTKKEKEEAAEKAKEGAEKAEKETKYGALTRSERLVVDVKEGKYKKDVLETKNKTVAWSKKHPAQAAVGALTGAGVVGSLAFWLSNAAPAAAETFFTNFPLALEYIQGMSTALHTVSNGVGVNALLGSFWGPIATGIAALPALGYARRKVLQSYGYTMPSYEGRMSAFIGNTGHGLRLLTIDAALAPFRLGKFALQKIAKSKALKPTKLGVGAAAVGAVLAPLTGGTSLAVGGLGYVGGNLYSHHSKKDSHGDSSNSSGGRPGRDPGNDSD